MPLEKALACTPKPQDLTLSVDNIQGWKIMYGIAVYSSVQLSHVNHPSRGRLPDYRRAADATWLDSYVFGLKTAAQNQRRAPCYSYGQV